MKVIAKTMIGSEFIFKPQSAHYVSGKSADQVADCLNTLRYSLKDGEKWYVYEIDQYDTAYDYAQMQSFYIARNGSLKRKGFAMYN